MSSSSTTSNQPPAQAAPLSFAQAAKKANQQSPTQNNQADVPGANAEQSAIGSDAVPGQATAGNGGTEALMTPPNANGSTSHSRKGSSASTASNLSTWKAGSVQMPSRTDLPPPQQNGGSIVFGQLNSNANPSNPPSAPNYPHFSDSLPSIVPGPTISSSGGLPPQINRPTNMTFGSIHEDKDSTGTPPPPQIGHHRPPSMSSSLSGAPMGSPVGHYRADSRSSQSPHSSTSRRQPMPPSQMPYPMQHAYMGNNPGSGFRQPNVPRNNVALPYNPQQQYSSAPSQNSMGGRPSSRVPSISPGVTPQMAHASLTGQPGSPSPGWQNPMVFSPYDSHQYFGANSYGMQAGMSQNFNMAPPSPRPQNLTSPMGFHQPVNQSFQSPTFQNAQMHRSASSFSEQRPNASSPAPSVVSKEKKSSAIKIINPDTKTEVSVQRVTPTPSITSGTDGKAIVKAPSPAPLRDSSPSRAPSVSSSHPRPVLTDSEKHERAEAARKAVLAKLEEERRAETGKREATETEEREREEAAGRRVREKEARETEEREKVEQKQREEHEEREKDLLAEREREELQKREVIEREEREKVTSEAAAREEREEREKATSEAAAREEREEREKVTSEAAAREEREEREKVTSEAAEREEREKVEREAAFEIEAKNATSENLTEPQQEHNEQEVSIETTADELKSPAEIKLAEERAKLEDLEEKLGAQTPEAPTEPQTPDSALGDDLSEARLDAGDKDIVGVSPRDTSLMGPPLRVDRTIKTPLDLPLLEAKEDELPEQPSSTLNALRSSTFIQDLRVVDYPDSITPPDSTLNVNSSAGKFKYDQQFLLQFQDVFTEKPAVDWEKRMKEVLGDSDDKRAGMGRAQSSAGSRTSRTSSAQSNPFGGLGLGMGTFGMGGKTSGTTSQQRFEVSTQQIHQTGPNPSGSVRNGPMSRTSSTTSAPRGIPPSPKMGSRSQRGSRRDKPHEDMVPPSSSASAIDAPAPLVPSTNRWQPRRAAAPGPGAAGIGGTEDVVLPPDVVQRKVKAALNKMTLEKFDRISDQILEIASQSKSEKDGRTLRQVIQLTFEKATDESVWSNMYARFCRKMLENIDPEIRDESIVDKEGVPVSAGQLFRKYLLNRCQEEFERGWKGNVPPLPEGATSEGEEQSKEAALLSEEYYLATAAKRRGLGLVSFIGELYRLQMLTERIMHQCIQKLLAVVDDPGEEEVESLCKLMTTVGEELDKDRGKKIMDAYIVRMQKMLNTDKLTSRIKFMILDVIDRRKRGWTGDVGLKGPRTIQEIHQEAAKQKAEEAAARSQRGHGGSHGGAHGGGHGPRAQFGRGDARNQSFGGVGMAGGSGSGNASHGGWQDVNSRQASQNKTAGDISRLGQFRATSGGASFGPSRNFSSLQSQSGDKKNVAPNALSKSDSNASSRAPSPQPTNSSSNIFDLLGGESPAAQEDKDVGGQDGRPKLNLLPRTVSNAESEKEEPPKDIYDTSDDE